MHYKAISVYTRIILRVLAIVIMSVRLSVCLSLTSRYRSKPNRERLGFSTYDSAESL